MYSLIISKFPGMVRVGITLKGSLGRGDTAKVSDLHPVYEKKHYFMTVIHFIKTDIIMGKKHMVHVQHM